MSTRRTSSLPTDIELIPSRLYFSVTNIRPHSTPKIRYFSIDNDPDFQYQPFFSDFGPLTLLHVHRFYTLVSNNLRIKKETKYHFVTTSNPNNVANAVYMASTFRMIYLNISPEEALTPFVSIVSTLKPYRDASSFPSTYDLSVLSCLQGLKRAMSLGWYNPYDFDAIEWEENEIVANGDMNWLIPNKLLAFASPHDKREIQPGWFVATPSDLITKFHDMGINHVVRLSKKFYDEKVFINNSINHSELFFPDGTIPPLDILKKFLKIIEGPDVVALHCKAGLGRTYVLFYYFHFYHLCFIDVFIYINWKYINYNKTQRLNENKIFVLIKTNIQRYSCSMSHD
ncbi:hypothetical protein TRFO_17883 [Tritrichomonas foetus]|uniref:protein-tyrosine-phosphatase n=1 Tax=Tritrichomonas foetus TaxID=1144522 RepID=A0A1J4KLX8_9EUKA|nr:hypothetical protein TRFO_17883 [Tritrichomonas foetus]|eukprot:OHT12305.1 hypothetical protein TRFO_17883 [Tritrichomonas foetus]